MLPYLVLLQAGFAVPRAVTSRAVRSYRTISPLPASRRYIFCGTFHGLAPPRCYLAPCPKEPGLSSVNQRFTAIAWPTPDFSDRRFYTISVITISVIASAATKLPGAILDARSAPAGPATGCCWSPNLQEALVQIVFALAGHFGDDASHLLVRQLAGQLNQKFIGFQ